jgi:hypothetical protein
MEEPESAGIGFAGFRERRSVQLRRFRFLTIFILLHHPPTHQGTNNNFLHAIEFIFSAIESSAPFLA